VKPQGVCIGFLGIQEFPVKTKLKKDRDLKNFRGRMRVEVSSWNQTQKV
jgi:hypothetical protein